jgi:hypothetical protein
MAEVESVGVTIPGAEVIIAYLALDSILALVNNLEGLADILTIAEPDPSSPAKSGASQVASSSISSSALSQLCAPLTFASKGEGQAGVQRVVCVNMIDSTWRMTLTALSALLTRAGQEGLVVLLLRGFQSFTYGAHK